MSDSLQRDNAVMIYKAHALARLPDDNLMLASDLLAEQRNIGHPSVSRVSGIAFAPDHAPSS